MEYSVEELKSALIEKCESEGILYATVAMDRRTKEMILPDTLQGALKHPEFFVCTCKKVKDQYVVEEITKVQYSPQSFILGPKEMIKPFFLFFIW